MGLACSRREQGERLLCVLDPMMGRHEELQHRGRLWSEGVSYHSGKSLLLPSSSKKSPMSGQRVRQVKGSQGRRKVWALCQCCAREGRLTPSSETGQVGECRGCC